MTVLEVMLDSFLKLLGLTPRLKCFSLQNLKRFGELFKTVILARPSRLMGRCEATDNHAAAILYALQPIR